MPTERRTKFAGGRKALLPTEPLPVVAQISHNGRSRQTAGELSSFARTAGPQKQAFQRGNNFGGQEPGQCLTGSGASITGIKDGGIRSARFERSTEERSGKCPR